ncbi:ComG operon protein 1 [Thalassobacillus devorans]|uniref:ComG operon protein 1 n=1 Tax=Thalassobacillus devorans TaxID=279813 RepID=A0ABQ1P9M3_9BACI|nr:competence type IV pilus ATPase ComGA [Thalassobacillus devorans]NIK29625.1 competence protein ComGA [Thalassobacillus devorans]GGC91577.1 ComG operon protein 1 [Thalassobacillus devorans]
MSATANLSNQLLIAAIQSTASDLHFSPYHQKVDIHFRIHGKRIFHSAISTQVYAKLLSYYKFSSGMDIGEIKKPQNGSLSFRNKEHLFSLRLSTLPIQSNESLAIRILPQTDSLSLDKLFLFPSQYQRIKRWLGHQSGMILFTGPTGSGKTTTLYALIQALIKENSYQAITLEDPIEKDMENIIQVQVNERAGITYDAGLKAALRHDPDLIMVGEIRDKQTAHFAFHAAHTGHLVLSSLHARDALGTILRLKEMGIQTIDLEQTLISIASQQLVPISAAAHLPRRAAILELLDGDLLHYTIHHHTIPPQSYFNSFDHLRRKAYAFGYLPDEIFS